MISLRTLLILVLTSLTAFGQAATPDWRRFRQSVRIGERVRVETAQGSASGELVEMTAGNVVLLSGSKRSDFQASEINRIYWLPGRSHNVWKWIGIGYVAGAAAGAVTGVVTTRHDKEFTGLVVVILTGLGGVAGAVIGFATRFTTTHKKLVYQRP